MKIKLLQYDMIIMLTRDCKSSITDAGRLNWTVVKNDGGGTAAALLNEDEDEH